ncbi:uncharacterized protein LOC110061954 isoform X2 [Orbicella faveolata]|uniref:uncharacterized protein LOC110061954 isoform X2 n=1 Tax=Orbicella faveolata TaxID=48498 RepID=UPI0009E6360D|nr:uncharacterized protein LOC110061954 isoform X2 [Orbicella faveolata]
MSQQALLFFVLIAMTQASFGFIVGQLSGTLGEHRIYPKNSEIKEFQADETFQGFTHENGRLKVQECGLYYIYAQVFFEIYNSGPTYHNRVALTVNGAPFSLMQTGLGGKADYGSRYTGGVVELHKDDYISLVTVYDSRLWVARRHTFFGAYRIGE